MYTFKAPTWKVVHEAGLGCYDPFCTSLTEDSNIALRFLTQGSQPTSKPLDQLKGLLICQPVIITQNHLQIEREGVIIISSLSLHDFMR